MRPIPVFWVAILLAGGARAADLTAVLSEVQGNVTVQEEAPRQRSSDAGAPIRQARFLQIVRTGDEIHVPAEAGAGLVCSNDRWVTLSPGMESRLTQDLCLKGKALPPGTYKKLAPEGGRFQSIEGAFVLGRSPRVPGFGVPTLLSPRNTSLLEGRPEIVWAPAQGATEYEIVVEGSLGFRLRLDASETPCNRNGNDWGEEKVCSIPWPDSVPDLPRGEKLSLSVGACHSLTSPPLAELEPIWIQRLTEERAEEVRSSLETLKDLPLEGEALQILEADVYVRAGVFSEAVSFHRQALAYKDVPESRITLGDMYVAIGLLRQAVRIYQAVLDSSSQAEIQAAAEFGLGKIEAVRRNHEQAIPHFQRARDLYALAGLEAEAEAADRALADSVSASKLPAP